MSDKDKARCEAMTPTRNSFRAGKPYPCKRYATITFVYTKKRKSCLCSQHARSFVLNMGVVEKIPIRQVWPKKWVGFSEIH